MTIVHWLCALLALATAPLVAGAAASPVAPTSTTTALAAPVAAPAPLAQWEQVLRSELADSPDYAQQLDTAIADASTETGVPPEVIWSVAFTETHGRHWNAAGAVKRGSAGEIGLMQVKPFWSSALLRNYGVSLDLYNVADNVRAGAYILSRGGADLNTMLSYYNTGRQLRETPYERRVMRYLNSFDELAAEAQDDTSDLPQTETPSLLASLMPAVPAQRVQALQPSDAVMARNVTVEAPQPAPSKQPAKAPLPAMVSQLLKSIPQPATSSATPSVQLQAAAPQVDSAVHPAAPTTTDRQLDSRSHGLYDPRQDVSWAN